nr:MAG TPA: hypothetical protein [Caudoviricetes sp.]
MTKDTNLSKLVINKLTTEQYNSITTKDPNQLYIVTDAPGFDESRTNCITGISQDINLELADGVLTLKAGSKVYVPNGFEKLKKYYKDVVTTKYWKEVTTGSRELEYACYYSSGELGDEYYYAKAPIGSDLQVYGTRSKEVASSSSELGAAGNLAFSSLNEDTAVFGVTFNRYRDGDLYIDTTATEVVESTPEDYTYTTEETTTVEVTADDDWTKVEEIDTDVKKFDVVDIASDRTLENSTLTGKYFIFTTSSVLLVDAMTIQSGSAFPSSAIEADKFYNTTENKFYRYSGTEWQPNGYSLPLAIVTLSSGSVTSIDQVFNGFGYIGSTVFALPGVKGLIPNGRNADGSLKNIETIVNKVAVLTFGSNVNTPYNGRFLLNSSGEIFARVGGYDSERNYITASDGISILIGCSFAEGCLVESGVIKTFNIKLPFRAIDYSDKPEISGWSMPSNKYIDLTLGANEATYTAPANGWVALRKKATASGQYMAVGLNISNFNNSCFATASGQALSVITPVFKNAKIYVAYNLGGETLSFKFYYAEGEN